MFILAGKFQRKKLIAPKGDQTRPTTSKLRESLFNIVQQEIEDALFLDLFAGSGAMGFEALSRGAKKAVFVEQHPLAIKALYENIEALNVKKETAVFSGDVMKMLPRLLKQGQPFTIIYADAPYHKDNLSEQLLTWFSENPLLAPGGRLFIEDANENPPAEKPSIQFVNSRRSGKAHLHQFIAK